MERIPFGFGEGAYAEGGGADDRFVARRSLLFAGARREQHAAGSVFDNLPVSRCQSKQNYITYLDDALQLPPADHRILNFSERRERQVYCAPGRGRGGLAAAQTWPCRPRARPYMGSADIVLDLPNYGANAWNYELVDWSRENMLLAALGSQLYVWSWHNQSLVCGALAAAAANCAKFSPTHCDTIAVALDSGGVETFAVETAKSVAQQCCHPASRCSVTALDWSPTGKSLVIGCTKGCLTVLDGGLFRVARRARCHAAGVLRVRVSPDARYLASLGRRDTSASIWQWPHLTPYLILESNSMVIKSLAWHPWRSAMLGVGGSSSRPHSCVLSVWDVAPARLRQPTVESSRRLVVDCMLFSHVTGEMVISCWMDEAVMNPVTQAAEPGSRVAVLGAPGAEVDKWCMSDRVNTMMFSPDGTKLAMATADEDLIILYYLPEQPKWKKFTSNTKKHSAFAVMLDEVEHGSSSR